MSKLIKVINNETIEIKDYRCPEAIFKYSNDIAPTLVDTQQEIKNIEDWCIFKETINPFQMYAENKRLNNIVIEARRYIEEDIKGNYFKRYDDEVYKLCDELLNILESKGE